MHAKQYEAWWGGHCFYPLFISIWNILRIKKGLKHKGPNNDIGEGGEKAGWYLCSSVSLVDAVLKLLKQ